MLDPASTGGGADGTTGAATVTSSGRFTAKTSGSGAARGTASPEAAVRGGAIAGAAFVARGGAVAGAALVVAPGLAAGFGVARVTRFALGTMGSVDRTGGGKGDVDSWRRSAPATGCLIGARCSDSLADGSADTATGTCAGISTARRSGVWMRRSRQGKPKPGSPVPSPKVRPNSSE